MAKKEITRDNHYVPIWYQKGFLLNGEEKLHYLNLKPDEIHLPDGRIKYHHALSNNYPTQCFYQTDLYSTFFGTYVNDEIEKKLFGDIDTRGAHAVRAFVGEDVGEWHRQFKTFFEYIDIQKVRTPKGLDWLSAQYPRLTQNELMFEMQGIRMMHCTIWTEGVREIVSAQDTDIKFIVSDHPVTIYNYAMMPDMKGNGYPNEPSITLKGSQTLFPLNQDFCLILTNLEYAQDHSANPLEKRTFAGNYRNSMVRTDAFIRTRKLTNHEVIRVNRVLKTRARRYIAAGKEEWLYPESASNELWADLRTTFLPPTDDLWHFGGEMYARSESGKVYYQDAFGRTEKERKFLKKEPLLKTPHSRDLCGCGSGRAFGTCCERKPVALRPTWEERSIRERNLVLFNGLSKILGIADGSDWVTIRREVTDEKIRDVYALFDALWPLETNLLAMLPKPDGEARAIYTGVLHPSLISNCALGLSLYFDELLIEHPFIHPRTFKDKFSPLKHPRRYRQEFLKSVVLFIAIMPLVEQGLVNLFPDPCNFDFHLRDQISEMARNRTQGLKVDPKEEAGLESIFKEEYKRSMLMMSRDAFRRQILRNSPELDDKTIEDLLNDLDTVRKQDPLAVLQEGSLEGGNDGGQLSPFQMAPNFEITMYLAQATGSCIVTDSLFRWRELKAAAARGIQRVSPLASLRAGIESAEFVLPYYVQEINKLAEHGVFEKYPKLMRKAFKYLLTLSAKGQKPNVEARLNAEFKRIHASTVSVARKSQAHLLNAHISCLWPDGGIQDNTVNRLLLMSNLEHHLASAPIALFVKSNLKEL